MDTFDTSLLKVAAGLVFKALGHSPGLPFIVTCATISIDNRLNRVNNNNLDAEASITLILKMFRWKGFVTILSIRKIFEFA